MLLSIENHYVRSGSTISHDADTHSKGRGDMHHFRPMLTLKRAHRASSLHLGFQGAQGPHRTASVWVLNMETGRDLGWALTSVQVPKRHRKKKYTHTHTHIYIWQIKGTLSFPLPFWKLYVFTIKGTQTLSNCSIYIDRYIERHTGRFCMRNWSTYNCES